MNDEAQDYRNQLLHIETISMMTKYQLVFVKMENSLNKVAHIIKNKESIHLNQAFLRILEHARTTQAVRKYKTQLIYYNLKDNTEKLINAVAVLHKGSMSKGFRAIWFASKISKKEKTFKEEKEKYIKTFNEAMLLKDQEITQYSKRAEELGNLVMAAKSKENDLMTKVKQKDKQIAALEFERSDPGKTKKSPAGDRTAHSIRALEERVRELQQENDELKDKLSSAETNVGSFIREMSDLLDSHELSVNTL